MKLILHIGAHKTASTHVQMRLARAQAALSARGAVVLGPAELREGVHLSSLLAGPERIEGPAAQAWRDRLARAEADGCDRLVLSEENLIGAMVPGLLTGPGDVLYPEAGLRLARLVALLGRPPTAIALAVREPSSFLTSAFGMWLLSGAGVLFEDFARGADPARLSWTDLARRVQAATGVGRLAVWRFEDYPKVRNQVLQRLVGPERAKLVGRLPPQQVGWSAAAYDRLIEDVLASDGPADLAALARTAREARPKAEGMAPLQVFSESVRAASAEAYAADWQALCALPGVRAVT